MRDGIANDNNPILEALASLSGSSADKIPPLSIEDIMAITKKPMKSGREKNSRNGNYVIDNRPDGTFSLKDMKPIDVEFNTPKQTPDPVPSFLLRPKNMKEDKVEFDPTLGGLLKDMNVTQKQAIPYRPESEMPKQTINMQEPINVEATQKKKPLTDDTLQGLERIKQAIDMAGGAEYQDLYGAEMLDKSLAQKGVKSNVAGVMAKLQKQSDMKGVLGKYTKALNDQQKNSNTLRTDLMKIINERYKVDTGHKTKLAELKSNKDVKKLEIASEKEIKQFLEEGKAYRGNLGVIKGMIRAYSNLMHMTPKQEAIYDNLNQIAQELVAGQVEYVPTTSGNMNPKYGRMQ